MIILSQIQKTDISDIFTFVGCMTMLTILVVLIGLLEYNHRKGDDLDDLY